VVVLINIAEMKSVFNIKKNKLNQKDIQKEHDNGLTNLRPVYCLNSLGMLIM